MDVCNAFSRILPSRSGDKFRLRMSNEDAKEFERRITGRSEDGDA